MIRNGEATTSCEPMRPKRPTINFRNAANADKAQNPPRLSQPCVCGGFANQSPSGPRCSAPQEISIDLRKSLGNPMTSKDAFRFVSVLACDARGRRPRSLKGPFCLVKLGGMLACQFLFAGSFLSAQGEPVKISGNQAVVEDAVASYKALAGRLEAYSAEYSSMKKGARSEVRLHYAGRSMWAEVTCIVGPVAYQGPQKPMRPTTLTYSWSGQVGWLFDPRLLGIRKTRTRSPGLPNLAGELPSDWMLNLGSLPWRWAEFLDLRSVREAFTEVVIDDSVGAKPTVTFAGPETSLKLVLEPDAGMMVGSFQQSGDAPGLFRGEYEFRSLGGNVYYPAVGRLFTDTPTTRAKRPDFQWEMLSLTELSSPSPVPSLGKLEAISGMVITSENGERRVVGRGSPMATMQRSLLRGVNDAQQSVFFVGDSKRD